MTAFTKDELLSPLRHETSTERISGKLHAIARSRFDVVLPQSALSLWLTDPSSFSLETDEPQLTGSGVVSGPLDGSLTRGALRNLAERLRVPMAYIDRLLGDGRDGVPMLVSENVNRLCSVDDRKALYRMLTTSDAGYQLRAVLSNKFQMIDNELALRALLEGLMAEGIGEGTNPLGGCEVEADISVDRMRLRIAVPAIELAVPDLLGDYRMPFSMDQRRDVHAPPADGETPPVIWAGVEITNSETGMGAFNVAPRAVVQICRNGLTRPVEFRRAHIGAALADGPVQWSDETRQNALALISSQVADSLRTFLSVDYLQGIAQEMRAAKGLEVADPTASIETARKALELSEQETADVFAAFARGGDMTVLGVANAITAAAQLVADGDRQAELETKFWEVVARPAVYA